MSATPSHHPTYNVRFTSTKIARIIACVFPNQKIESIEQLQSGKSFNNRIYFVKMVSDPSQGNEDLELVLKVSGQFFGADKVQNEVASLYLVERYCRTVPAPRVLAWCDDGVGGGNLHVIKRTGDGDAAILAETTTFPHAPNDSNSRESGWILSRRRPGRVLDQYDLAGQNGENIMRKLAYLVSQIRKAIPTADRMGNLRLHPTITSCKDLGSYDNLGESHNRDQRTFELHPLPRKFDFLSIRILSSRP